MKTLVIFRGAPGAGKSTILDSWGLKPYTLSADDIRLLYQAPVVTPAGTLAISQNNDNKVWALLMQLLEERMARGEFTVVDAVHSRNSDFTRYKKLKEEYGYRVVVVDMTDVPRDEVIRRNKLRPEHKQVPDDVIDKFIARFATFTPQTWLNVIKPHQLEDVLKFEHLDFTGKYKKIHVIGDLHGCWSPLKEWLDKQDDGTDGHGLNTDSLYIFVGDWLDRGIQNGEVLSYLTSILDKPNVIFIEGNHEHHVWMWANDKFSPAPRFEQHTRPQLESFGASGIDKKLVRQLIRKLIQVAWFKFGEKYVLVTHGGLPGIDRLRLVAGTQMIYGPGRYENMLATDTAFLANTPENVYQVHGHRNIEDVPIQVNARCFNLEGDVEFGGSLRTVTLDADGNWTPCSILNTVFEKKPEKGSVPEPSPTGNKAVLGMVNKLRASTLVNEKVLTGNVSSFNFTKRAFIDKSWNELTLKARGLFVNTVTGDIVARSYNKFFNIGENEETRGTNLKNKLTFPVVTYVKYNGFLGLLGYDPASDSPIFASKSTTESEFAGMFRHIFDATVSPENREKIFTYLRKHRCTLVFEVIDPEHDPHIIEYPSAKVVLLDAVKNDMVFSKLSYEELIAQASEFGLLVKERDAVITDWPTFCAWRTVKGSQITETVEGYVIEDAAGFYLKEKLPYYQHWRGARNLKDTVKFGRTVKAWHLMTALSNQFYGWLKKQSEETLGKDIITLRKMFALETGFDTTKVK